MGNLIIISILPYTGQSRHATNSQRNVKSFLLITLIYINIKHIVMLDTNLNLVQAFLYEKYLDNMIHQS